MPTVHMLSLSLHFSLTHRHTHPHTLHTQTYFLTSCLFPPFFFLFFHYNFFLPFPLHHFLHLLIISPYYLSSTISPSPDLLSKLVKPSECRCLDGEAPIPSTSQVQRHPVNFLQKRLAESFKVHAYKNTHLFLLSPAYTPSSTSLFFCLVLIFFSHSSPLPPLTLSAEHLSISFPPFHYLSSPVFELSLADAPDGSIILEHLSAVCLHHGSSAATGATGK